MSGDEVRCAICGKVMSAINNRHLKQHNLTADEYRLRFPNEPLLSDTAVAKLRERSRKTNESRRGVSRPVETRHRMSEGQLRNPPRRSHKLMSEQQKQVLSDSAKKRYAEGFVHPNTGKTLPESLRQKISRSLSGREIGPEAAKKAIQTRRERGDDLAFMRGKKHSDETKILIGTQSRAFYAARRADNRKHMIAKLESAQVAFLSEITDSLFHLKCLVCGYEFTRTVQCLQPSKFHEKLCRQCHPIEKTTSQGEDEVAAFLKQIAPQELIHRSDESLIPPLQIDILLPQLNLAVEYCGLYYHGSRSGRHKLYHQFKMKRCREVGIRLLTIYEDEWLQKRSIVESMLRNACGLNTTKISARQCQIREISVEESSNFLNDNHIQGRGRSRIKYGLFLESSLVSVMTFQDSDITHRGGEMWAINRFASKIGYNVRGAASRLFRRFIVDHAPDTVTSYADLRWGTGKVYAMLGFVFVGETVPNWWYFKGMKRYHRFALRKTTADPKQTSEFELRAAEGWSWIYDCGHAKWLWTKPTANEKT